ncbi:hypothetical protein [Bacillus sp. 3255]|uniref:hypothetical protein n=1 Tax=Bacillus sp. 3255 TaxID=2817904 RepID=UPI00286A57FF|nr:hypothetical protein [Bacillus sp. 3255]
MTACLSELFIYVLGTKSLSPMLAIIIEALGIHYMFRLRKLHALMIVLLGAVGYTMLLAVVLFVAAVITSVPMYIYFDSPDVSYRLLKIAAAIITLYFALYLQRNRLGFTLRLVLGNKSLHQRRNQRIYPVFVTAFFMYSSAYYGVSKQLTSIFYWAAGFCIMLAWMLYLLYRKEMDEL